MTGTATPDDIDLLRDMVWLKRADERSTYSVDIVLTPDALGAHVLAKGGGKRTGVSRKHHRPNIG